MPKKSKVYFVRTDSRDLGRLKAGLKLLVKKSPFFDSIRKKEIVPVKLTFGEKGNKGYPHPELVKIICDKIKSKCGKPFLTDSNVLYHGSRTNGIDHINLAYEHGFLPQVCGAPIVIADGVFSESAKEVELGLKHLKTIKIPPMLGFVDSLFCISHFKGHMLTGFGGSIKNIGMGFASRAGKQAQHSSVKPSVVEQKCVLCGKCIQACQAGAIIERSGKAFIQTSNCTGCGDCIAACRFSAVEINWAEDVTVLEEKMAEYAYGILRLIKNKYFVNILATITKECDCLETGTTGIADDVGMLASGDPVALDKACLDLVMAQGKGDVFKNAHPEADYTAQLEYSQTIALGSLDYDLEQLP